MLKNNVKIIKHKVGLLNLAEELGNVSRPCKTMDLSRDTFYRYKAAVDHGVESLFNKSRRQPNLKNRVDDLTKQSVLTHAIDYPTHDQLWVSNELRKAAGVFVSPNGVRSICLRHGVANFKDPLKALESKVAEQGIILTETQIAALKKKNAKMTKSAGKSTLKMLPPRYCVSKSLKS